MTDFSLAVTIGFCIDVAVRIDLGGDDKQIVLVLMTSGGLIGDEGC